MEFLPELEKEYDRRNIPLDRRMANKEEFDQALAEDILTNNTLDGIGKILS
jgi:hypothetical protein